MTKATEKEASTRAKAEERAQVQATKAAEREGKRRLKLAEQNAKKSQKILEQQRTEFRSMLGGAAMGAIGIGTGIAAAGAGVLVAGGRQAFKDDDAARRIAINSGGRGRKDEVRAFANKIAQGNKGHTSEEVLSGLQAMIDKTGDLDDAMAKMDTIVKSADASGASITDLATTAGDLKNNQGINSNKDLQTLLSNFIQQGRSGAFELKDLAQNMASAGASAGAFDPKQFKGVGGATKLGGLLQLSRQANGSGEEATTSVTALFSELQSNADILKKKGKVNVRSGKGKGQVRDINDILVDVLSMKGSNFQKKNDIIAEVFGRQGSRVLNPLKSTFESTYRDEKGKGKSEAEALAAAQKAVRAQLEASQNTQGSYTQTIAEAATVQASASAQLVAAWEKAKNAIGDSLIDTLSDYSDQIGGIVDKIVPMIEPGVESLIGMFESLGETVGAVIEALESIPGVSGGAARVDTRAIREKRTEVNEDRLSIRQSIAAAKKGGAPKEVIASMEAGLKLKDEEKAALDKTLQAGKKVNDSSAKDFWQKKGSDALKASVLGVTNPVGTAIDVLSPDKKQKEQSANVDAFNKEHADQLAPSTNKASTALDALNAKLRSAGTALDDLANKAKDAGGNLKPIHPGTE